MTEYEEFKTPSKTGTTKKVSCNLCTKEDNDEMVQCDVCDKWYHFSCALVTKDIENEDWVCPICSKEKPSGSVKSGTSTVRLSLELEKLEEEKRFREEKEKAHKEYLEKKYKILKALSERDSNSICSKQTEKHENIKEWVKEQALFTEKNNSKKSILIKNDFEQNNRSKSRSKETNNEYISRIVSANAPLRDLPKFSGNYNEWPIFYSNFITSTKECGYTNEKNLIRLQKALTDEARRVVQGFLLVPDTVPELIETLRKKFGRPELIISDQIDQIISKPDLKPDRLDMLIDFAHDVRNMCAVMRACDLHEYLQNPMLLRDLVSKLTANQKTNWAIFKQDKPRVTLEIFERWLSSLAEALYDVETTTKKYLVREDHHSNLKKVNHSKKLFHASQFEEKKIPMNKTSDETEDQISKCKLCKTNNHLLSVCEKFIQLDRKQKWEYIKRKRLCRRCFGPHFISKCKENNPCGVNGCLFKHHPLLHNHLSELNTEVVGYQNSSTTVLFRILPVKLYGKNNKSLIVYAFLDEGSSATLLEEEIANILELEGPQKMLCLKWTSEVTREELSRMISMKISGSYEGSTIYEMPDVKTVRKLDLPTQSLTSDIIQSCEHLKNIPIETYDKVKPKLLIGIRHWNLCIPRKIREGKVEEPVATKTNLGWAIYSPNHEDDVTYNYHHHVCECNQYVDIQKQIKDFFLNDDFGVKSTIKPLESNDNKRARLILENTTKRIGDRFETGLLWKSDEIELPNSLPMAKKRLQCLQRKLARDPVLKEKMQEQINSHIKQGYIRKLRPDEITNGDTSWYLPIFPVINQFKKKIRIVFDAAAEVRGVSLNSVLLKGPDLLQPLPEILWRFRERAIAVTGDIKEMFHQVKIIKKDQNMQRFLWGDDELDSNNTYLMQVMTFGATCSPSSAQFTKNLNAMEYEQKYPRAANSIVKNHYVDDFLESFDTPEEATKVSKEVKLVHSKGGFEIRNWQSNSTQVLRELDVDKSITTKDMNCDTSNVVQSSKVLGMWWETNNDAFVFQINPEKFKEKWLKRQCKPTKRDVLRTMMAMYDPMGLIAFILINAKLLLQDIWRTSIGWDQEINDNQFELWNNWIEMLQLLQQIKIPRCYINNVKSTEINDIQLHIFTDGSESACATVAYIRYIYKGEIFCSLVGGKTKVSPQKPISIPRMELQGAVIGARYADTISKGHTLKFVKRVFWTDSKTVLSWINSNSRQYRQFVALRIGEILELSNVNEWRWVPSKLNTADEGTKLKVSSITNESSWFQGPTFLREHENMWPQLKELQVQTTEDLKVIHHHQVKVISPLYTDINIDRFSKWKRLVNTQVYVLRCIDNMRKCKIRVNGPITPNEIVKAENMLYRQVQWEVYKEERCHLTTSSNETSVDKNSKIYAFSPIIDDNNVLRAKGRLELSNLPLDLKQPIILPKEHRMTQLIIQYYHEKYYHQNSEVVVNELRQKYMIPNLRTTVKKVIRNCNICRMKNVKPLNQEMAPLPEERTSVKLTPFSHVGIDYFGPFNVINGRKLEKRYGVIFTCLNTRASHIELAYTLSTASCIMCIRNFINRRGTPLIIMSDNGTNFHGAKRLLENEIKILKSTMENSAEIKEKFNSIQWKFIPPAAPHMGGCWERIIRIIKRNLEYVVPNKNPTEEQLRSGLIEIENILNSRPLTYIPTEVGQEEAITPNHFLLGSSGGVKPPTLILNDVNMIRDGWKYSQRMAERFWERLLKEYFPTLNKRSKWRDRCPNIQVNDLVVIVDETRRNSWKRGIITKTIPGKDGRVREVIVKTSVGSYRRPITKVALLNIFKANVNNENQTKNSVVSQ